MTDCNDCVNFKPKKKLIPKMTIEKNVLSTEGFGNYLVLNCDGHHIELDGPTEGNNEIRLFIDHEKVYSKKL